MPDLRRLGFVQSRLLRHSAERSADPLPAALADPAARTLLIAGETPVLRAGAPATSLLPLGDVERLGAPPLQLYLGTLDGGPVIATQAPAEAGAAFAEDPAFTLLDLRSIAVTGAVPPDELGLLATGKALLYWHGRHRFCGACGAPTTLASAGFRRDCTVCGTQHFPRTDPVVIMLVARGDRCLLARQARFPPGMHSCLAGFLEPGETVEDAVRRETFEEAGVRVGRVRYLASQPWPFPASIMIGCLAEGLDDTLTLDREELEDGRWFTRAEVGLMLERRHPEGVTMPPSMAIANHLIRAFVEGEAA